jgi:hypothetical protein
MAIARDANVTGVTASGSSLTTALTTSGSNRILFVGARADSAIAITGITYAGVALTLIDTVATNRQSLWYLINPTVGTNNIVVTPASTTGILMVASSYTGAKQSGVPDSHNKGGLQASPITVSTTTVADNCWVVGIGNSDNVGLTAGTGYNAVNNVQGRIGLGDSNGVKTPAGSYSMTVTDSFGDNVDLNIASFAPFVATGPTNVKAIDGLTLQ